MSWTEVFELGEKFGLSCLTTRENFDSVSGVVHTGVEVHRMDSEMSGLVKQPWVQLICCAVCLLYGYNFR